MEILKRSYFPLLLTLINCHSDMELVSKVRSHSAVRHQYEQPYNVTF